MDNLEGKFLKAYKSEAYPKFLASVDADGVPNVVPVLTLKAADPETLVFARMMVWKTAKNMESTRKVTACCYGPGGYYYRVRAEFDGFVKSGPYVEDFNKMAVFRYNSYAGATDVGVFKVKEVLQPRKVGWAKKIIEMRSVRNAARVLAKENGSVMPPPVVEHFNRRATVKYLAHVDDEGWPSPYPVFSLFPAGENALVFKAEADLLPDEGALVAASSISHLMIAYQVKGTYRGLEKTGGVEAGVVDVNEVYTASPPLPGKRVYPPE